VITGSGNVTLESSSTQALTLTGVNTYTGTTIIQGSTLKLSGLGSIDQSQTIVVGNAGSTNAVLDISAKTGGLTIGSNQTLKGIGTIAGASVTTTIQGMHAAGNSVGLQTFTGNLHYDANSIFEWELTSNVDTSTGTRGVNYDAVNVSGTLTADSNAIFRVVLDGPDVTQAFWNSNRSWSNIFSKSFDNAGFNTSKLQVWKDGSLFNTGSEGNFSITNNDLTWTVVPEPSSLALSGFILLGLMRRKRR
jgi:hypothetical protein